MARSTSRNPIFGVRLYKYFIRIESMIESVCVDAWSGRVPPCVKYLTETVTHTTSTATHPTPTPATPRPTVRGAPPRGQTSVRHSLWPQHHGFRCAQQCMRAWRYSRLLGPGCPAPSTWQPRPQSRTQSWWRGGSLVAGLTPLAPLAPSDPIGLAKARATPARRPSKPRQSSCNTCSTAI